MKKYRQKKQLDGFYATNNSRRMHGLPLHRKKNKKKRYFTRNEPMEAIGAFLDYCNGVYH